MDQVAFQSHADLQNEIIATTEQTRTSVLEDGDEMEYEEVPS